MVDTGLACGSIWRTVGAEEGARLPRYPSVDVAISVKAKEQGMRYPWYMQRTVVRSVAFGTGEPWLQGKEIEQGICGRRDIRGTCSVVSSVPWVHAWMETKEQEFTGCCATKAGSFWLISISLLGKALWLIWIARDRIDVCIRTYIRVYVYTYSIPR